MEIFNKSSKNLQIFSGNTGIIYFDNGDVFIPNYDLDRAIELTIKFLNIRTTDGKSLSEIYNYDGFNWVSIIISDLFWQIIYPFVMYEELLNRFITNQPNVTFRNPGKCKNIYSILYLNDDHHPLFKTNILNILKYVNNRISISKSKQIIFDIIYPGNFRTLLIEQILNSQKFKWIPAVDLSPRMILKSILSNKNYLLKSFYTFDLIRYDYDLSLFDNNIFFKQFTIKALSRIEHIISNAIYSYKLHKKLLKASSIKLFISMDEANSHVFPLLYACKKLGIPTVGVQHGLYCFRHFAYSQIGLADIKYDWFDTVFVWGEYWKNKLLSNPNLKSTNVIIMGNKFKTFNYKSFKKYNYYKKELNILIPYEFLANSFRIGKYLEKIIKSGHNVYFKIRPDEATADQVNAYCLPESIKKSLILVKNVDENFMEKIDAIIGTQTTYIYELLPFKIPIFILNTEFKLLEDMVNEGLAIKLNIEDIRKLPELVKDYKYKGQQPSYYFAEVNLVKELSDYISQFI